jgi:hypothetical protein
MWKRLRYSCGETRSRRWNALRMDSALPKPHSSAMGSMDSADKSTSASSRAARRAGRRRPARTRRHRPIRSAAPHSMFFANIHPAVAINQSIRFGRDQFDLVGGLLCIEALLTKLVCFSKNSQRPGNVQNLGSRKGDDADPARGCLARANFKLCWFHRPDARQSRSLAQ